MSGEFVLVRLPRVIDLPHFPLLQFIKSCCTTNKFQTMVNTTFEKFLLELSRRFYEEPKLKSLGNALGLREFEIGSIKYDNSKNGILCLFPQTVHIKIALC